MYSKQEESILRKQFWTGFGQYLVPVPSVSGNKINWINYKTGIKHIQFKMDADRKSAYIAIEVLHNGQPLQDIFFNHFKTLQQELESSGAGKWNWEQGVYMNGKKISRIYQTLDSVNIYKQEDWPAVITFLKSGIVALDKFWTVHKDIFEMLS